MLNQSFTPLLTWLRQMVVGLPDSPTSDRVLLGRFVSEQDQAAFAALVARHGPLVLGTCYRLVGREQDAEDAFQAVFLVLARKAGSLARVTSLAGWLYQVAVRVSLRVRKDA